MEAAESWCLRKRSLRVQRVPLTLVYDYWVERDEDVPLTRIHSNDRNSYIDTKTGRTELSSDPK